MEPTREQQLTESPPPDTSPTSTSPPSTVLTPSPSGTTLKMTGKADLAKRFIAALIDGVLASICNVVPIVGPIVGAAYMLIRDGLDVDFMKQRSLGKHFMKLRPVRLDGQPMDIMTSVKRNFPFAIGPIIMIVPILGWVIGPIVALIVGVIEIVLVLTDPEGRRLGDKIAGTKVIEVAE